MRKFLAPVLMASTMLSSANSNAETYYFSFSEGDDSNDGLSEGAPFKTVTKLSQIMDNMVAGDVALLKRGDVWEPANTQNISGPCMGCTVDVYGSGDAPYIQAIHSDSVFFYLNNSDGWTFKNFTTHCYTGSAGFSWSFFLFNGTSDIMFDDVQVDNCTHGVYSNGNESDLNGTSANRRITVKNSRFNYNGGAGWLGGGGGDFVIDNNIYTYNGWENPFLNHSIYWSYWDGGRITNNKTFHSNSGGSEVAVTSVSKASTAVVTVTGHGYTTGDYVYFVDSADMWEINHHRFQITVLDADTFELDGVNSTTYNTFVTGKVVKDSEVCSGAIFVGHGYGDEVYFGYNKLYEDPDTAGASCWGMPWDAAYAPERGNEQFTNMTVEGNILSNLGNVYFGMGNTGTARFNFNRIYHDNNKTFIRGFYDATQAQDPGLQNNDVIAQYNLVVVTDDSGNDLNLTAGMDFSSTDNAEAKNNYFFFGDTANVPCTIGRIGEFTQTDNVCIEGSSFTDSTIHTTE